MAERIRDQGGATASNTSHVEPRPDVHCLAREWPTATAKQRAAYVAVSKWLLSDPASPSLP
ncbi:hypothetical protein [Streptomyces sp. NPDC056304]|uniref:hypothetical protein n=1 Tax=Streptomyces sp. NPDC056304 TaxID=3345778 RepID=UPI0035DCDC95